MALLLITVMMPGTVTFFPQFLVYVKLGWYGTLLPLSGSCLFGKRVLYFSSTTILSDHSAADFGCSQSMRMRTLPYAVANCVCQWQNLFSSLWCSTPLSVSGQIYLRPLIYILSEKERTFPVLLSYMNSSYSNASTLPSIMAGGVLSAIPTLLVYFLGQKVMIKAYVFKSGDK